MPNNIIFNETAEELKAQVFGLKGTTLQSLQLDDSGNLMISGSMTVSGPVTVVAESLSIRALSGDTDSVAISGTVTVAGTVTVGNTVTVVAESLSIRSLSADTDTVSIGGTVNVIKTGNSFTENNATITDVAGTGVTLLFDSSQQTLYSYYVKNNAANTIQVRLQISPTDNDDYFINDQTVATDVSPESAVVIAPKYFLRYTRLYYDTGTYTADFEAYCNGHV
ncbi:hypothetical protein SAMN05443428_10380 [Caloramator quimbayensis]|uniref:DUF6385 domain-containing protein n=1 Tax=Caloramator quimbayensis TaxID=1147123 RepID=A0A1T4WQ85_9CLOT|nr:DUF6385 domain-containing protein [Caloramator quimbayensis]SKA79513.1 hypothetical protein SAMN05443428_10380 [Caloramator quimbayensis]